MENLILEYYSNNQVDKNKNLNLIIEIIEVFSQKLTDLPEQLQKDWNESVGYVLYNFKDIEAEEQVRRVRDWVNYRRMSNAIKAI